MRRRRHSINYDEIAPVQGDGESFRPEKELVRSVIRAKGLRRDGLSKKFEVYKKKVNGETFRVKFYNDRISFDKMIPKEDRVRIGDRGSWRTIMSRDYYECRVDDLNTLIVFPEALTPEQLADMAENQDTNEWLERLGVKFV